MEYTNRKGTLPEALCFSFAAFIEFYKGKKIDGQYIGKRADGTQYQIKDDAEVLDFFADLWANNDITAITKAVLSNTSFWSGNDLTSIPGLSEKVADYLYKLETMDVHSILKELVK